MPYFVVKREINGEMKRFIERMYSRLINETSDGFFVDCGLRYDGEPIQTLYGLDFLEGKAVSGLAVGGVAAGLVGTALGVTGSIQSGNAQARMYGYQAQVNRQNAVIAQNNAAMERQAGLEEARRQRIKTLQVIGQQKVGMAAGNVDVGYGTPLDALEDTATIGELDALMLEYDAEKKARNYEIEANNYTNQANLDLFAARNAKSAGQMNALATGVKGIGSAMNSFAGMAGGFSGLGGLGNSTKVSGGIMGDLITFA